MCSFRSCSFSKGAHLPRNEIRAVRVVPDPYLIFRVCPRVTRCNEVSFLYALPGASRQYQIARIGTIQYLICSVQKMHVAGNAPLPSGCRLLGVPCRAFAVSGSGAERRCSCSSWSGRCCSSSTQHQRWTCCCSCRRAGRRADKSRRNNTLRPILGAFP